jgi:GT2 family glycosyltransferase
MKNQKTKVQIQIVTWNSLKFLPDCLSSIFSQTYKNFNVLVIDNASNDGTIDFLLKNYPEVKIFRNNKNLGFATAHNQGIKLLKDNQEIEYILVINPDIILEPDFLKRLLSKMEEDKKIGAISGKIFKIYTVEPELNEKIKTKIIDSTGLKISRSRKVFDRAEGELDKGEYDKEEEVFGLSAACVLYRLSALKDVKIDDEYFDSDFFAYKEDFDLSYRLRWRGWKLFYFPKAIAYHFRQVSGGKNKIFEIIRRRKERSYFVKYLSYRNHLFTLIKNESFLNFLKDFFWIFFYELGKFFYLLLFEQKTLLALIEVFKKFPKMLKKRRVIMKNRKISSKEIRKWFI